MKATFTMIQGKHFMIHADAEKNPNSVLETLYYSHCMADTLFSPLISFNF